ncbi:hypothetical protein ACWC4D_33060 [Streptomyces sp. NPDC001288]
MSTNLKDKTVLVVGRGSGIARAVSAAVLAEGGRVVRWWASASRRR